jgi:small-conductance mechanosensitive channel
MPISIPRLLAAAKDSPEKIDFNIGKAWERVNSWVDGFTRMIPNLVVSIVMMILFIVIARVVGGSIVRTSRFRKRGDLGDVLGGFARWAIYILGFLLSATVVIPSLHPGDLIAGLGISSVAIGFAFKDILQNWLAGLLILIQRPFRVGDQIEVKGHEGTVQRIETRATIIRTYDGQRIVIPNRELYTNSIVVRTAHDTRRSDYDIGVGYGDDIDAACAAIVAAVARVGAVETNPAPEALVWDLAASWVTIRARWWTNSLRTDVVHARAAAIREIKLALDAAGIDLPFETKVQLFHDQTEDGDRVRGEQREGWPARQDAPAETPAGSEPPAGREVESRTAAPARSSGCPSAGGES